MTEVVHSATSAGIRTLTLDSPKNRNALSTALVDQLLARLREASTSSDVRAVVLTHTGGTFCAGADLSEALARGASVQQASAQGTGAMLDVIRTILELPKPVIVVVDGHVRAGGFGLLGAADIVLAGPSCTFALTESRLGLSPSVISLVLLPKMSARAVARYFVTGETFDAQTAEQVGLVTESFSTSADIDAGLGAVIAGIRRASPQGLAASKALTTTGIIAGFAEHAQQRADESAALFASDEAREGMAAFLAKRRPSWDLAEHDAP